VRRHSASVSPVQPILSCAARAVRLSARVEDWQQTRPRSLLSWLTSLSASDGSTISASIATKQDLVNQMDAHHSEGRHVAENGAPDNGAGDQRMFVEQALGLRIVRVGRSTEYTTGIQKQWTDNKGKVFKVAPGTALELVMFNMLCTPQADWGREVTSES
jgi:hypothetical protein